MTGPAVHVEGRDGFLDVTRGLAMVGIVAGHVMVGVSDARIGGATFGGVNSALYLVHVPLFAFVSGLMLAGSARRRARWPFLADRVGTLLWLYLVWTAVQGAFELLANPLRNNKTSIGAILDLWTPLGHLWFLPWLAICTGVALLIQPWRGGLIRSAIFFAVAVLSLIDWGYEGTTIPERGVALVGVYLLGAALTYERFVSAIGRITLPLLAVAVAVAGTAFALINIGTHFSTPSSLDPNRTLSSVVLGGVATAAGMTAIMGLALMMDRIGIRLRLLQWIGRNTMAIFLLHIIFAAGTRIVLLKMDVHQPWVHVVTGTLVGLLISLLLSGPLGKVPGLLSAPWRPPSTFAVNSEEFVPNLRKSTDE